MQVFKMHAEGVLCKFCHVHSFKTFVDGLQSVKCMKTEYNLSSDFRKQNVYPNSIKCKPFNKKATRILKIQCSFTSRHQLTSLSTDRTIGECRTYRFICLYNPLSDRRLILISTVSICPENITKTYLYDFDPLKPHFYIVKLGYGGVYFIFTILFFIFSRRF